jgi:hypothetical protein
MIENIQKLDYIAAHYLEKDKVYQDILKDLESSLCAIESCVGEMRSDETIEDKDVKYFDSLAKSVIEKNRRVYLYEHIIKINAILKGITQSIDKIPEFSKEE